MMTTSERIRVLIEGFMSGFCGLAVVEVGCVDGRRYTARFQQTGKRRHDPREMAPVLLEHIRKCLPATREIDLTIEVLP